MKHGSLGDWQFHPAYQNIPRFSNRRPRETKCTHYFKLDNGSFHVIELVQHLEPGENKEGMAYCVW